METTIRFAENDYQVWHTDGVITELACIGYYRRTDVRILQDPQLIQLLQKELNMTKLTNANFRDITYNEWMGLAGAEGFEDGQNPQMATLADNLMICVAKDGFELHLYLEEEGDDDSTCFTYQFNRPEGMSKKAMFAIATGFKGDIVQGVNSGQSIDDIAEEWGLDIIEC